MTSTIAGVVGSLRERSVTRVGVRVALEGARANGAETNLIDLREYDLPVYDADRDEAGDAVPLREQIQAADAVILGTAVYHGSYSAPLKNALDYSGFDEFEYKTVGLLAVAGGSFPLPALDHLRSVMRALDAWVLPFQVAIPNSSAAVTGDELVDGDLEDRLETLGQRMVQYANIEPDPRSFEGEQNVGADD